MQQAGGQMLVSRLGMPSVAILADRERWPTALLCVQAPGIELLSKIEVRFSEHKTNH